MTPITPVESIAQAIAPTLAPVAGEQASFASQMVAGLEKLNESLNSASAATMQFAVGESVPPHEVMLALEEARMNLQLVIQVRNRLLEGYQELMRMQL